MDTHTCFGMCVFSCLKGRWVLPAALSFSLLPGCHVNVFFVRPRRFRGVVWPIHVAWDSSQLFQSAHPPSSGDDSCPSTCTAMGTAVAPPLNLCWPAEFGVGIARRYRNEAARCLTAPQPWRAGPQRPSSPTSTIRRTGRLLTPSMLVSSSTFPALPPQPSCRMRLMAKRM